MPVSPQVLEQLADIGAVPLLIGLAVVCLLALAKGWVVPRYVYDQVVQWNDGLLDYSARETATLERLATIMAASEVITPAGRHEAEDVREEIGPVPGPARTPHRTTRARA